MHVRENAKKRYQIPGIVGKIRKKRPVGFQLWGKKGALKKIKISGRERCGKS